MSVFTLTPGIDNFTGNPGETNTVFLTPSTLQATDTITGGATGSFLDILTITAGGTITAAQFAGVSRFELLNLAVAGNNVSLTNGLVANSSAGIFSVVGNAGNDTVNAAAVTNAMRIAFYAGSGTDSFVGGNGNDYVEFATAELAGADSVNGGNGFDFLAFSTGGTVTAAALASVTSIEEVLLSNAGNSITLSNAFVAGADNGVMSIVDGTGNDTVDASGVTNGTRVVYFTSSGNETFVGGNGSDYLSFHADQLTSADHVTGGANYDIIEFDTAGTVAAGAFTNVTGIDELILNSGGNNVTLGNAMVAGTDNGVLVVLDNGSGSDVLNASAVASNRIVFQSNGGNDSFTGGGGSDVALFTAAGLTSADTFAGGTGFDVLQFTTAGTVGASAFTNFTGVDELFLTLGSNNITLNGGVVANSDNAVFVVFDQAGNNTINASAATLGGRVVFNAVAGDHDTYTGGTGSDFFQFADANLNNTDTLAGGGGAGTDFLQVTTAASVTAADLANVSQMEVVQLLAGGSIALGNSVGNAGGSLEVDGTSAVDSIDGSAATSYDLVIKGAGGADTLKGGSGNDQIFLPDTNFAAIDGNGGIDKIVLTSAFDGLTFDLSTQAAKITDVEAITLESATNATLHLAPADIPQVNSSTNLLYVVGDADNHVTVDGTWTALETNHTNAAVSATHTFIHFHNSTTNSDLYVDSDVDLTISSIAPDANNPVANPDTGTAVEDVVTTVTGNVLANDTDADGDPLVVTTTGVFVGTYGNLTLNLNGSYSYALGATAGQAAAVQALATGSSVTDQFSYSASDGSPPFASSTLTITVYGTDDAPTATATVVPNATEDTAYSFNVTTLFTDIDSVPAADTLTYSVAGLPAGLSFAGSTISGTPTNDDVGTYTISVTANDGHSGSLTRIFSFSVANTNDAPVGTAAAYTINEDAPLAGTLAATDVDGNNLTFSLVGGSATNGSATVNSDGTFTFTPAANFSGDATFQFRANDGTANSVAQTVTIHVTPVNDAPTAAAAGNTASTNEDNAFIGNMPAGSDIDDTTPSLTYELVSGPNTATEGSLTFNTDGSFLFSPASNFNGAVAFTYRVVDPHGAHSDPQTFTITVDPVNDPVGAVSDTAGIAEDVDTNLGAPGVQSVASGNLLANDSDGDPELAQDLDVTAVSGPGALTNTVTTLTRTDADGSLVIDKETGAFTYTVDNSSATVQALGEGESLSKVFTYTATDDGVPPQSSITTLTVTIVGTNDGPVAVADTASVTEDSVLSASGNVLGPDNSGPVNDSDIDGDTLAISAVNGSGAGVGTAVGGSYGSLTLNSNGSYAYSLTNGSAAVQALGDGETLTDTFTYTVSDGHGGSASTTLSVTINGTNAAPTVALGSDVALNDVASSSDLGVAIADATASITDEEGKIKAIEVDISSGYQDGTGSTGERAELSAAGNFGLSLHGGSASFADNGNHGTLTITFASPVSTANALAIFKQVNYVNQTSDFSLAVALDDTRTVTVRVQDHDNVWSATDTREVNVAANVLDGGSTGTFVGSRFADTINGAAGDDTLTGGKGNDTIIGGSNTAAGDTVNYAKETDAAQVSETGTHGVTVNLSGASYDLDSADSIYDPSHLVNNPTVAAGSATDTYGNTDTLSGIENVVGTKYDDVIVDEASASNGYSAGEGTGPTPEAAGDTVAFNGTLGPSTPGTPYFRVLATGSQGDDFSVQYFDPDLGPSGTVLATDTLTDVENMIFDNGLATSILNAENPVWVIEDGYLVGTFTTVAAAVAKANLLGGTTVVEIGHGTTPPAGYDEGKIDVTRAMTIKGIGAQQVIHATDGVDLFVVAGAASGLVRFENLALSDDGVGPTSDYGIRFAGTYGVNSTANLQVSGVSISGFEQNGVQVIGGGTTVNVAVDHSVLSGNGGGANSGGSGDILFFEYTGAASLDHVTVTGTTSGTAATTADYGIQFAGFHDTDDAIANAIGNVSFNTVTVTGHYDNALVYVQGYHNLSGLAFAATQIGDAGSTAGWTGLYVEPKSTNGPFTPSGATSTLDLTNVTLAGTYGWQTTFQLPGANLILGEPTNDHIIGSASADAIRTLTGTDQIEAAGGNDLIVYDTLPGAKHTVDGGSGTDTQVVFGTAGAETFNLNAISATQLGINIVAGTAPASTVAADGTNYEVATTAVEEINIQTGNGGDNVVITGDLHGTGVATSTITVIGGTGNDTVDASGMTNVTDTGPGDDSRVGIAFTGGTGNDTFISNSIGTADSFDGGGNTDTVDYSHVTGGGVSVHLGNQSATDIGGTGVGTDTLIGVENAIGSAQHDVLVGSAIANTLTGGGGDDSLAGNAGNDTLAGGLGTDTADYSLESGTNGVTVDLGFNTATDTFGNTDTLTSIENATGTSHADTLIGGTGANVLTGLAGNDTLTGTGNDTLRGGANDDVYYAHMSDDVVENIGEGTDEVRATESYTLDANVENLTLLDDGVSDTQDFENFGLGPITAGENGWHVGGPNAARDQEVVSVSGNKMFRMSSDPSVPDFAGPFSPSLGATAGESTTSADFNAHSVKFVFKPVDPTPDGSRLEVDFGNAAGTDRNNFMVLESVNGGIRIAVAQPNNVDGDFDNPGTYPNDWRELVANVDPAVSHTLEMRLLYVDGPDNDLINIYLDGHYIGATTTFENYRDLAAPAFVGATHADNAEANQTDRVFFRPSANGAPQDGALGTVNKGFYFDNVTSDVHNNIDGTGNDLANIITGNAGDNTLAGKGANDQLIGGAGVDTAKYDDAYANYAVTYQANAHGFVTGASQVQETGPVGAVNEGTDALTGIERLAFSNVTLDLTKRVQLFDSANKLIGTFDHIQDAINAGADGYTIRLAAGTFTEAVTVDRNIAILGANSGDPGTGSRSAESIIAGQVSVTAAHSATQKVTIDGIEIFNTSSNSVSFTGIQVNTGADVAIKNSMFFSPIPNASSTTPDRAIMLTTGASGTIDIDHNLFTGGPSAHNLFSTAAWTTAIWSDGAQTAATIAFNAFEWVRTAINADDFHASFAIANNTFQNSGSGISIGGAGGGANADVASITSIHDNTFSNVDTDFNLQNISAAGKQVGLDLTATNNHAVNTAADPVTVLAGQNADTIKGSVGVDALIGNGGNDSLDGGAGNDGLAGNGADDTLHGGAGDDALFGGALAGADSGKDTATYDDARANYTLVTTTADGFVTAVTDVTETTVNGTNEGHDTLSGIEVLQFGDVTLDLTQNVQLFDSTGKLIGTFGTIQSAVNAAAGNGGINETIRLRDGVYTEQVTVDGTAGTLTGLTIRGANVDGNPVTGVTIKAPAVLGINGVSDHWGDNIRANIAVKNVAGVTISNVTVDGSYAGDTTSGSNGDEITGIAYLHASGTVSGVHVEHTSNSIGGGLFGLQHGSGIFADNGTGTQLSLAITGSTIDTFQKTGILVWNTNVNLQDTTVAGVGPSALIAQNAMQIGGSSGTIGAAGHGNTFGGVGYTLPGTTSTDLIVYEPSANLTITANTFNGTGASGASVGLDLTDVSSSVTVTVTNNAFGTTGFGLIDGIDAYTFDGTIGLGSDPVMSGNTFTEITGNGIFLDPEFVVFPPAFSTNTAFTETGSQFADVLHGSNGADNFSGGAGNDDLMGRLGVDTINGGAGDDTIAWRAGDGNDSIDGGNNGAPHSDQDTLNVAASGHNLTLTASGASFTVAQDDAAATNTATVTEVEEVNIALNGGETITLVGDFTAAGVDVNSIVVDGSVGTGGKTVDAGGMTSTQHIGFTGGTGNDTFIESNAGGNDTFAGGGGIDTVDFSHETTGGITVDLSNTGAQNTVNAGTDTFTGVENVVGTGSADTITGNGAANTLSGGNGADTFTGGLGDDTIYGGNTTSDTSTTDKAIFSGSSATYTITFDPFAAGGADGIDATVSGADGTDTLHGVELLQFGNGTIDLTKSVLLFDSTNHLIGTFDHIQDAVNAADGSGDTIKVRNGLYVEQVTIDATKDGLKIIGESEAGVTVQAPNTLVSNGIAPSNGRNVNGVIVVDGADNVQVKTLTVDGALKGGVVVGASNPTLVGVSYLNANGGLIDHVTVTHVRESDAGFGNQRNLGIFVSNTNPSGAAPTTPSAVEAAALKTIEISHTTVTDFQKGGIVVSFANASVHDNTVTGHGLTGLTAQNGIQLAGSTGSINGNTVTAVGYNNPAVAIGYAILTFNNLDVTINGNHVTGTGVGPTDSSGGIAAIGSTGVVVTNNDIHQVIDAMDVYATASFVDALAPSAASNPGGVFDFSTNAVDANVPSSVFFRPFATSTDSFVVTGTNRDDELHGASANDTLNGGAGDDFLDGRGGADTINGGTGNDVILISAPSEFAAGESINGGADTDTIRFASTTASDTLTLSSAVTGVENVTISDANGVTTGTTALNVDASAVLTALSITGNDGANSLTGTAQADTLSGNGGDDLLTAGNGADTIHGGGGLDTANYTTAYAGHSVAWNGATATVTGSTDTGATGDVIDGVGKLQFTDKAVWLVNDEVGSEYTTLAQLFDGNAANGEAANGDIIILDDGTYTGDVTVNKAVTILGANAGVAGTGSRSAESIIEGQLFVTAGATIDGIEVHNTTNNATQFIGVRIQNTAADVTVKNSVFYSTGPNGSAEDRAINMDTTVSGHVTIANNLITGDQTTSFGNSNWHRGIWSDGSTSQLDITGNTFDHVRSGMNLDGLNNATTNVSGNTFLADGTGIAVGGNYVGNPAALSLTAIHDNFFNNTAEDLNGQNFTTDVSFDATATNNTATEAGTPVFFVDGGRAGDTLTGTAGVDVLLGHALDGMVGNDSNTLTGKGGDDLLIGANGTGTDTAVYSGTITAANITATSAITDTNPFVAGTQPGWTVSAGAEGTDTLSEIEIVDGNGAGRFLLVGNGGYASINAALAAAATGDTILIAPGTYNENVVVNTSGVTIKGAGAGVIIHGTFKSDNGIADGGVATFLKSGAGYTQTAGAGITINADNVTISNLQIDGFTYGVNLGDDVDFASVSSVSFTGNLVGVKKGTTADITNFSLTSSSITDGLLGIDFDKDVTDATLAHKNNGLATGITIDGVSFTHLVYKGAYFEALSNAHLTNISMDDVAQYGAPSTSGTAGSGGNGIDLNLKNGDYANVEIDHFTLNNTGASDRDGLDAAGHQNGGAIVLESRDQGSYLLVPGTFTGAINVHDGTISGHTSTGVQVGEPNQSNLDPDVTVTAVSITGEQHSALPNGHGDIANITQSTVTVNMLNGGDSMIASPTTTGQMVVNGGTGADTITTGGGADTIDGGGGTDTVDAGAGNDTVIGTADGVNDSYTGGSGTDTIDYSALTALQTVSVNLTTGFASGVAIGTDTLSSFENANGGSGNDSLFGSDINNVIHGNGGTDNIVGGGGSDQLFGDAGADTLNGGVNDFSVTPSAANDVLWGGADTDTFRFEGRFGNDSIGTIGNADWTDTEDMVFVGYAAHTPIIADVTGGVLISIDDGSVASSVFVAGAISAQMQQLISGADLIIH